MTALGTETSIDKFRKAGAKPFVLALLLYVWLVVGGYFLVKYLTPYLMYEKSSDVRENVSLQNTYYHFHRKLYNLRRIN